MTLSNEQWLLLGMLAVGWLYFSGSKAETGTAPVAANTGSTETKAQVIDYGLPSWQDLGSQFNTRD
jgi:hypothetical protein